MPDLANIGYDEIVHNLMVAGVQTGQHTCLPDLIRELAGCWVCLYGFDDASEINTGTCEDFAHDVKALWPGVKAVWDDELAAEEGRKLSDGSHCVIVWEGRYYDAECPDGVDHWRQLPYFVRLKSR